MASLFQQSSQIGNRHEDCEVVVLGAIKASVGSGGDVDGIKVSVKSPMVVVAARYGWIYVGGGGVYGDFMVLRRKEKKER